MPRFSAALPLHLEAKAIHDSQTRGVRVAIGVGITTGPQGSRS